MKNLHAVGAIVVATSFCVAPAVVAGQCLECLEETITCGTYAHITNGETSTGVTGPQHDEDCVNGWCIVSEDGHGLCTGGNNLDDRATRDDP